MRKTIIILLMLLSAVSCETLAGGDDSSRGAIRVRFATDNPFHLGSKSGLPDTNRFILSVVDAGGRQIYKGAYGDAPDRIIADPGSYTVSAVSTEFSEPRFEAPQYGDSQVVAVSAGQTVSVLLDCVQQNAGVRLNVARDFISAYPDGNLYLKSSTGTLMYGYTEKRTAYFKPGAVTLSLSAGGEPKTLFTRVLEPQQILVVNVSSSTSDPTKAGILVQVDTSRRWTSENFVLGTEGQGGGVVEGELSVTQARLSPGLQDVWVYGYIVGGDLTSARCSFDPPFSSRTNLVMAAKSSCRDKESCLSVQLSAGDIRDALNLVDNPDNLGRQIKIKGDIVPSYYGIPGIQGVTEFKRN